VHYTGTLKKTKTETNGKNERLCLSANPVSKKKAKMLIQMSVEKERLKHQNRQDREAKLRILKALAAKRKVKVKNS